MKRNTIFLTLILSISLFFFVFVMTGLFVFYLVFDNAQSSKDESSGVVRIRTITNLESASPVTEKTVVLVEAAQPEEAAAESVVVAPTLFETDDPDAVLVDSQPVKGAENEVTVVEIAPVPDESVIVAPPVAEQNPVDSTDLPQEEALALTEDQLVIEIPAEPVRIEQRPLPEGVAKPVSSQKVAIKADPAESSFVPGSSFFDQLLDQVE